MLVCSFFGFVFSVFFSFFVFCLYYTEIKFDIYNYKKIVLWCARPFSSHDKLWNTYSKLYYTGAKVKCSFQQKICCSVSVMWQLVALWFLWTQKNKYWTQKSITTVVYFIWVYWCQTFDVNHRVKKSVCRLMHGKNTETHHYKPHVFHKMSPIFLWAGWVPVIRERLHTKEI